MPTSRYSAEPDAVMMRTRSPGAKPSSSAVVLSMTTSSGARGGAPAMMSQRVEGRVVGPAEAERRRAVGAGRLPVALR